MKYSNHPILLTLFIVLNEVCSISQTTPPEQLLHQDSQQQAQEVAEEGNIASPLLDNLAIIGNGIVRMAINKEGNLISRGSPGIGLQYNHGSEWFEVLRWGGYAEGFGVSATIKSTNTSFWGGATNPFFSSYLDSKPIISTESEATTVAKVTTGPLKVTHKFAPSKHTKYLYEITVTYKNTSQNETLTDLRYRRNMDWDVYPPWIFRECVSIFYDSSSDPKYLEYSTNYGFSTSNPTSDVSRSGTFTCPDIRNCPDGGVLNNGPRDNGAMFNFLFKECGHKIKLPPCTKFQFKIYYGAAPNKAAANRAVRAVGSTVTSFAFNPVTRNGSCSDADGTNPGVFIFGFNAETVKTFKSRNYDEKCSSKSSKSPKGKGGKGSKSGGGKGSKSSKARSKDHSEFLRASKRKLGKNSKSSGKGKGGSKSGKWNKNCKGRGAADTFRAKHRSFLRDSEKVDIATTSTAPVNSPSLIPAAIVPCEIEGICVAEGDEFCCVNDQKKYVTCVYMDTEGADGSVEIKLEAITEYVAPGNRCCKSPNSLSDANAPRITQQQVESTCTDVSEDVDAFGDTSINVVDSIVVDTPYVVVDDVAVDTPYVVVDDVAVDTPYVGVVDDVAADTPSKDEDSTLLKTN